MGRDAVRVRGTQARRQGLAQEELIEFCRGQMAKFKAPRAVVFGELPKTSTGKIQKFVLREKAKSTAAIDTQALYRKPSSPSCCARTATASARSCHEPAAADEPADERDADRAAE